MKFILISVGTRGDIEPFLATADILVKRGHEVIGAFPEQFHNLSEGSSFRFYPLSKRFIKLVNSAEGKGLMGRKGSLLSRIQLLYKLFKEGISVNAELVAQQFQLIEEEKPDKVIFNEKASYPFVWSLDNPGKAIMLSPIPGLVHYVKEWPHVGFRFNWGSFFNKLTYRLANAGLTKSIQMAVVKSGIPQRHTKNQLKTSILSNEIIYTISPTIFPKPGYWPKNAHILGYHERNKSLNWKPGDELLHFLQQNEKFLLITFGSMQNAQPEHITRTFLDVLERNNIPAIFNIAAGGLAEPASYNHDKILFLEQVPYDYLLPKTYAIIHHGGSGTTHSGLKYGCATMIIPHIIDQFLWNGLVNKLGAGPKGPAIDEITTEKIEEKVQALFSIRSFKLNAERLGNKMRNEACEEVFYQALVK